MEEIKALVEPFPFVPAMCMRFNLSKSDGCESSQPGVLLPIGGSRGSHLIPYPAAPFYHLRYCILVQAPAGLPDGIDDGEVALQSVQRRNGILISAVSESNTS